MVAALLTLSTLTVLSIISYVQERAANDLEASLTIKQLWSADQTEREAAKTALIRLGQRAIPPLIALLNEIRSDPRPRYVPGREHDAAEAEARYRTLLNAGKTEESHAALNELMNLRINWRLKSDVCELLGRIRAEEAIPALIDAMISVESFNAWETMSPQMQALIAIGAPGVPKLIDAIETAGLRAGAINFGDDPIFTEEARRRLARIQIFRTQARSCMVLGEIGDATALPVLEKLLAETDDQILSRYIKDAIVRVRVRSN